MQALNRTGWFKPIKEGSEAGPVQRLTNKLSGRSLALLLMHSVSWLIGEPLAG